MIPGCTHAIGIELLDHTINLFDASNIYVTISQGKQLKTFLYDRIEIGPGAYNITIYLTQEESLAFKPGPAQLQVNWLEEHETYYERFASDVVTISWSRQLLMRLLPLREEDTT